MRKQGMGRIGLHAALHYLFAERIPQKADEFYTLLAKGNNLSDRSPILALRSKLLSDKRLTEHEVAKFTIKAWNAWIKGRSLQLLKSFNREGMPAIEG